jgi:D-lyxose ketol-isomerase
MYSPINTSIQAQEETDETLGDFRRHGLTLFTLRNGHPANRRWRKPYCEKLMIAVPGQNTPMHYHSQKTEDIIVRGGGNLAIKLQQTRGDDHELSDMDVRFRWMASSWWCRQVSSLSFAQASRSPYRPTFVTSSGQRLMPHRQ